MRKNLLRYKLRVVPLSLSLVERDRKLTARNRKPREITNLISSVFTIYRFSFVRVAEKRLQFIPDFRAISAQLLIYALGSPCCLGPTSFDPSPNSTDKAAHSENITDIEQTTFKLQCTWLGFSN